MKDYFLNLIKGKTVVFYIGAGIALLSIIAGFVYVGAFINPQSQDLASTYTAWIPVLMILSGLIYLGAAVFKYDNYGLGAVALCSFISLLLFILNLVPYVMSLGMADFGALFGIEGITPAVVVVVFQLIVMIAGNVLAWIPANLKEYKEEELAETAKENIN